MKILQAFLIVSLLLMVGCGTPSNSAEIKEFAQCLSSENVTMYGAYWCSHCQNVKNNFGTAFKHLNYVECDPHGAESQASLCLDKGVESYPTWEFADGTMRTGELSFDELAQETGCTPPEA